jgi:HEPN domain-containing protein
VLDFCSGTGSVKKALLTLLTPDICGRKPNRRGLTYVSLDITKRWSPTVRGNVLELFELRRWLDPRYVQPGYWDVVYCSLPSGAFSTANKKASKADTKHARASS